MISLHSGDEHSAEALTEWLTKDIDDWIALVAEMYPDAAENAEALSLVAAIRAARDWTDPTLNADRKRLVREMEVYAQAVHLESVEHAHALRAEVIRRAGAGDRDFLIAIFCARRMEYAQGFASTLGYLDLDGRSEARRKQISDVNEQRTAAADATDNERAFIARALRDIRRRHGGNKQPFATECKAILAQAKEAVGITLTLAKIKREHPDKPRPYNKGPKWTARAGWQGKPRKQTSARPK